MEATSVVDLGLGLYGQGSWAPGHLGFASNLFLDSVRPGEGSFPTDLTFLSRKAVTQQHGAAVRGEGGWPRWHSDTHIVPKSVTVTGCPELPFSVTQPKGNESWAQL